jgi:ABC-type dipeptide/oligopeptide/nickel transport system ATPase subunit/AmiR/NasT family two-component response regulator
MAIKDLLIVDDDPLVCDSLKEMFLIEGYRVDTAAGGEQALEKLREERFRVILSDIQMPGINGLELLRELKGRSPDTPVIFITGHGHIDGAVEAIKMGAYDYITKPIEDLRLKLTLRRALEQAELQESYQTLKKRLRPWELAENLVFKDRKMAQLLELVHTIADTMATVLITGESGTGKSMLARIIAGLLPADAGEVRLDGRPASYRTLAERRRVQMIFQQPTLALDPRQRIVDAVVEPLLYHRLARTRQQARARAREVFTLVGLHEELLARRPAQISGGQAQRVAIARALALEPALLVADEPTAMLDASIQAQIIQLLRKLQTTAGVAVLFISHDQPLVQAFCSRYLVLEQGVIVGEQSNALS